MKKNKINDESEPIQWLKLLSRISAWLLLAAVIILLLSGWGITRTEIIYKATFGLVDRRLANSMHRVTNTVLAVLFLSHVLLNIRLIIFKKIPRRTNLIDSTLIIIGLILAGLVFYIELQI